MRKRLVLVLAAALIVMIVLLYPSLGCKISEGQIRASPVRPFVVPVLEGYAIGFTFNLTNLSDCELTAESIGVDLRTVIYPDGSVIAVNERYSESLHTSLALDETRMFSYSFDSYFEFRPAKLVVKIEVSFGEAGNVAVFDGELEIPAP